MAAYASDCGVAFFTARPTTTSDLGRAYPCCSIRRADLLRHPTAAVASGPGVPPSSHSGGQPGERSRGLAQSQAKQARRRLQRDGGKRPTRVRGLQCGLKLSVRKPSVCGASDRRCVTLASCATANQNGLSADRRRLQAAYSRSSRPVQARNGEVPAGQRPAQVEPSWSTRTVRTPNSGGRRALVGGQCLRAPDRAC